MKSGELNRILRQSGSRTRAVQLNFIPTVVIAELTPSLCRLRRWRSHVMYPLQAVRPPRLTWPRSSTMPRARGLRLESACSHHHLLLLRPCLPQSRQTSLSGEWGPCPTLSSADPAQSAAAQKPSPTTTLHARAERRSAGKHRQAIKRHYSPQAHTALLRIRRHRLPAFLRGTLKRELLL